MPDSSTCLPMSKTVRKTRGGRRRNRRLPPGQRLIAYLLFAGMLILAQGILLPMQELKTAGVPRPRLIVPIKQPFLEKIEMRELTSRIEAISRQPRFKTGVYVVEPATGRFVNLGGKDSFPAASMIKIPVLVALLSEVDEGAVDLKKELILKEELIAGGSGFLQWREAGSRISVADAAELMIKISDNTATNLLIDLLGGIDAVNAKLKSWGLHDTRIHNLLPDLEGTNTTSPHELALLVAKVQEGSILSRESKDLMFSILKRTRRRNLLPAGLGPGATIYHKTGDIGSMVGDAGMVVAPNELHYFIAVQVERPRNNLHADQLIADISHLVYGNLVQGLPVTSIETKTKPVK